VKNVCCESAKDSRLTVAVQLLLRIEKYPHRLNLAKGILESRVQSYAHLRKLLKAVPLRTPTHIELQPGQALRVTLFDANHCPGAVSFLIEDGRRPGPAIFYSGDVRAEPALVAALAREPALAPYVAGLRPLDCLYLDTTFAARDAPLRAFRSKADGVAELLRKVAACPPQTLFYVEAWTFGYEDVWVALAGFLGERVHLDRYRYGLYSALANAKGEVACLEGPPLGGFMLGNHRVEGCLTRDPAVRIHSCEHGWQCPVIRGFKNKDVVRIVPIVSRTEDGAELHELGIGGGKGDLNQTHVLDLQNEEILSQLRKLCAEKIIDEETLAKVDRILKTGSSKLELELTRREDDHPDINLDELVQLLIKQANEKETSENNLPKAQGLQDFPREITFPYSRHSSYEELCALVEVLKPRDIYPCTVVEETWDPSVSMKALFGQFCAADIFEHDRLMTARYHQRKEREMVLDSPTTGTQREAGSSIVDSATRSYFTPRAEEETAPQGSLDRGPPRERPLNSSPSLTSSDFCHCQSPEPEKERSPSHHLQRQQSMGERSVYPCADPRNQSVAEMEEWQEETQHIPNMRRRDRTIRQWAYLATLGLDEDCDSWEAFGGLSCVKEGDHDVEL